VIFGSDQPEQSSCSRAGCGQQATRKVSWRNPRIHTAERVKVWLACDEHEEFLAGYLSSRSFPVVVSELSETISAAELTSSEQ
jgi:hypothetical protein